MTGRLVAASYRKPKMCYATHSRADAAHSKFCKMYFYIVLKFTPVYL